MRTRAVVICTIVVGAATLAVFGEASAQQENPTTPGAIPNPGSYQGSTELQRQQDQQDQQFRQQQQTQSPNWGASAGSRAYGPGSQSPSHGPPFPCWAQVAAIRSLQPLAANVALGTADPSATYLFDISSRPTASEQVLLRKWLSARRNCRATIYASPQGQAAKFRFADARWGALATEQLTEQLISGQLTYGQFNRIRVANSITMARIRDTP